MPIKPPPLQTSLRFGDPAEAAPQPPASLPKPDLDWLPIGVAWFDAAGRVLQANARFRALSGFDGNTLAEASPALQGLLAWQAGQAWPPVVNGQETPTAQPQSPPCWESCQQITLPHGAVLNVRSRLYSAPSTAVPALPLSSGSPSYLCLLDELPAAPIADSQHRQQVPHLRAASNAANDIAQETPTERELQSVLEASPIGIAYLRGDRLVRCNQRFERLLALAAGSSTGRPWHQILDAVPQGQALVTQALASLDQADSFKTEIAAAAQQDGTPLYYTLDVRRISPVQTPAEQFEALVLLSNVTERTAQRLEMLELGRERELMFDLSGVGIAFVRDGTVHRANTELERLLGYSEPGLVGLAWASLMVESPAAEPAGASTSPQAADHALRVGDEEWTRECLLKRANGSTAWFEVTQRRVAPEQPSAGVILCCLNVDDRHHAQREVAEQSARTRTLLDSVFVGVVTVGDKGIEWMNRSARRMFAGDLADFQSQPISTVATDEPNHPFRCTEHLSKLPDGQAHNFECQVKARDGRLFWVVGNAVATFGSRKRRQITYALMDIERRRAAEARTAEAQASLQRIIEMAPLAITLRDARSLQVLQMNQTAAAMSGVARDQAAGKTPEDLHGPELGAQMRADMESALAASLPTEREYHIEHDAQARTWDARYLPLSQPGLPPDQLLLVATDVTEQRAAAKAQLDAAIAQREMLVREVHHRIKNNLQGVAGLLQQIASNKPDVAPAISEVVGQVQAIAQVYGLQVGSSGPLKVRSVVEAIAQSVQRTYKRTITLRVEGDSAHEWVLPEAESIPIALCLNELLANAAKHSQTHDIDCRLVFDQYVHIEVHNYGTLPPGFALERVPGGISGLGLVRALLPRRGAKLSLEQRALDVVALLHLLPPGVSRLSQGTPQESSGQQITLWPQ